MVLRSFVKMDLTLLAIQLYVLFLPNISALLSLSSPILSDLPISPAEESYTAISQVHHGACRGVDSMADQWARQNGFVVVVHPAEWELHGRAAGPVRNQQMVDVCDHVVAFLTDTSRGTRDTVTRARRAGLPVTIYHI